MSKNNYTIPFDDFHDLFNKVDQLKKGIIAHREKMTQHFKGNPTLKVIDEYSVFVEWDSLSQQDIDFLKKNQRFESLNICKELEIKKTKQT